MVDLTVARRSYLLSCAAVVVSYVAVPSARPAATGVLGALSFGAIVFGVARQRPPRQGGWLLIATTIVVFTIGNVLVTATVAHTARPPHFPGLANVFFLATYGVLALGLVDLGRPRQAARDWVLILDAVALSAAGSLVVWIALVRPALMTMSLSVSGTVVALASWVGYTAVVACAARVALVWRNNVALNLLTLGTLSFLIADYLYGQSLVDAQWRNVKLAGVGYAIFVIITGAAALTSSMRKLSSDGTQSQQLGPRRLAFVAIALFVAPTVLLFESTPGPVTTGVAIAICGSTVALIMLIRLWLSARAQRRRSACDKAMSLATRSLVEVTTTAEVVAVLQAATAAMLPPGSNAAVHLGTTTSRRSVLKPGATAGEAATLAVPVDPAVSTPVPSNHVGSVTQIVFAAPMNQLTELRSKLTALSDQAGAALGRIEMMRRLRADERERYFRTLVLTSADATLISRDGRIDYATPSAHTIFGRDVRGALFDELVRRSAPGAAADTGPWATEETSADGLILRSDGEEIAVLVHRRDLSSDPTVNGVVSTLRDVTAEQRLRHDLAYRASHDPLTGLSNARAFGDELRGDEVNALVERRGAAGDGRAALFVDLDDFKEVNDTYGHEVGDQLLTEVARRISSCLREGDVAARLGGDEFGVLLRGVADETAARSVAQRIVDALAEPATVGGIAVAGQASLGLAYTSSRGDLDTLLRNADTALYNAKAHGKGRWWEYRDGMTNPTRRNVDARRRLQDAIVHDRLTVYYQPIVELTTGLTIGFEALIRSADPRQPISPEELIGVAEDTGLITKVGEFVLGQALADLTSLCAPVYVSVNVSARQLARPDFVAMVRSQLSAAGADPTALVLEITKNLLIDDDQAWSYLNALHDDGVRIAIDDYGTGYASLSYLRQRAIDIVKIDRSFVDDHASPRGKQLLRGVTALCTDLGLEAIAEGVRDADSRASLVAAGCPFGQGFYYAPALPIDDAARWIAEHSAADPPAGRR